MVLNTCIIGYGSAGKQHREAIEAVEDFKVHSIFDMKSPEISNNELIMDSWEDVLDNDNIDVVSLCIPPGKRTDMAKEALYSGKSVVIEKPAFKNIEEMKSLARVAETVGKSVAVMFQHRYRIPTNKNLFNWGEETTAILEVSRPREIKRYFQGWRASKEQSIGGIAAHLGVHYLDLACFLLGNPISIRDAGRREYIDGIDVRSAGTVTFDSGAVLSFIITGEASKRSERIRIFSNSKTFTMDNGEITIEEKSEGRTEHFPAKHTTNMRQDVYKDLSIAIAECRQPTFCNINSTIGITKILSELSYRNDSVV